MLDGFIKTAASSLELSLADCDANAEKILECSRQNAKNGVKIIAFGQLSITGCSCRDLFLQQPLINGAKKALAHIVAQSKDIPCVIIVGLPLQKDNCIYNCAAVVYQGQVLGFVPEKTPQGCFGALTQEETLWVEFEEKAVPMATDMVFVCCEIPDFSFGIEMGQDAHSFLPACEQLACRGANIIFNFAFEKETVRSALDRNTMCISRSAQLMCGYVYVGAGIGESSGDGVCSGACIIAENGKIINQGKAFAQNVVVSDIDTACCRSLRTKAKAIHINGKNTVKFSMTAQKTNLDRVFDKDPFYADDAGCDAILKIQSAGLKRRLEHINAKSAVIGVSGGLDSALALIVAVGAMEMLKRPAKDIIAVSMPCFGTSKRTKSNAQKLCQLLGVDFRTIDIKKSVMQHFKDICHDPQQADVVYENAQARERTQILMDIANAQGGIVVGTGDLSELALGFATYNGDHMSMYSVNSTLPKTLIRRVVSRYADITDKEIGKVLRDIVNTPVSPELLPTENGEIAQKTEQLVGAYELHDFFIYYMVRYGFCPSKIYRIACSAFEKDYTQKEILSCLKTFYRRFFAQQYKRSCMPEGSSVSGISLSPRGDWNMPSDAMGKNWIEELERIK